MRQQNIVTWKEFAKHTTPKDCWVLIDGNIYNVSDYLVQHPGGDDILIKYSGTDASEKFRQIGHTQYAKSLRNARCIGKIQTENRPQQYLTQLAIKKQQYEKKKKQTAKKRRVYRENISLKQISLHCSEQDCWTVINGRVYDLTDFLNQHPGGVSKIMQWAGKDSSKAFVQQGHSLDAMRKREQFLIGTAASQNKKLFISLGVLIAFVLWSINFSFF